jgi:hypothetical protein
MGIHGQSLGLLAGVSPCCLHEDDWFVVASPMLLLPRSAIRPVSSALAAARYVSLQSGCRMGPPARGGYQPPPSSWGERHGPHNRGIGSIGSAISQMVQRPSDRIVKTSATPRLPRASASAMANSWMPSVSAVNHVICAAGCCRFPLFRQLFGEPGDGPHSAHRQIATARPVGDRERRRFGLLLDSMIFTEYCPAPWIWRAS